MYRIGFVIITWNSEKYIEECLYSLANLDVDRFRCVVSIVDNGSTDRTKEIVKRFIDGQRENKAVIYIFTELDKNRGTTYSRNLGLKKLPPDQDALEFICILDSDTEINSMAFETMCEYARSNSDYGIIGPRMHNREMVYQVSGRNISTITEKLCKVLPIKRLQIMGEKMQANIPKEGTGCVEVGYLMSACWLMRKEVQEEIGYLDERIFYSPEDLDYCIRCWKAGYRVVYCYNAEIVHLWQRISRQKMISRHNFDQLKGLGYLFRKYHYAFSTKRLWASFDQAVSEREKLQRGE